MAYKILTKNGIDNSNIDGARGEYFNSGMRDGIVQGALNEGLFTATASNIISLDTCELRIAGHRIVIDEPVYHTFTNTPSTDTRYAFVAQIVVDDNQNVDFSLFVQTASRPLIQNDLYKNITGAGTYQVEIGRFTLTTGLVIEDVVRTIDVITGGSGKGGSSSINVGNVVTEKIEPEFDAEVDIDTRYEEDEDKEYLDFKFSLPIDMTDTINKSNQALANSQTAVNTANDVSSFAQHLVDTPDNSEANNIGTANVSFVDNVVDGVTYKKFKFSNLKGDRGDALILNQTVGYDPERASIPSAWFSTTPRVNDEYLGVRTDRGTELFIGKVISINENGQVSTDVLLYSNIKGENGDKGDRGFAGLICTSVIKSDELNALPNPITVNKDYITPDNFEINDIVLCTVENSDATKSWFSYYVISEITDSSVKMYIDETYGSVAITGEKGDKGLEYLTVKRAFDSRYPVGNIAPYHLNDFNRTPVVNDIFSTLCANQYYTTFKIVNTETKQMQSIGEVDIKGEQGNTGDTGLIRNNFSTNTIIPAINTVYDFNQQSNFSRIPVVGETFLGVWKQSQDNRSWMFTAEVTSSSEESVLAKVVSLSETTASIDNAVDLVSNQTVGGEKTFTDNVYFKSNDGTDKKIEFVDENDELLFRMRGSVVSKALVLNSTSYYIRNRNNGNTGVLINPDKYIRPEKDNDFDLGTSENRLKDVYVAGKLSDGTNNKKIADLNKPNVRVASTEYSEPIYLLGVLNQNAALKDTWQDNRFYYIPNSETLVTPNISDGTTTIAIEDIAKKSDIQSASGGSPKYNTTGTSLDVWKAKAWSGFTTIYGRYIWTDGENIYFSSGGYQYVLVKSTSTWSVKTWSGFTTIYGDNIWADGENIYFSRGADQYVLDKSTSTWSVKTWSGLTTIYGRNIWTDGENIYYSSGPDQYVLDKSTSTWSVKTWSGLTSFSGDNIWTDGENIYYSYSSQQYVLDKSTSTWSAKTWNGLSGATFFSGSYIWTDGENIYLSSGVDQYVLVKSTSTWSVKTWSGFAVFSGSYIWTDGENIYCSDSPNQYVLTQKPINIRPTLTR